MADAYDPFDAAVELDYGDPVVASPPNEGLLLDAKIDEAAALAVAPVASVDDRATGSALHATVVASLPSDQLQLGQSIEDHKPSTTSVLDKGLAQSRFVSTSTATEQLPLVRDVRSVAVNGGWGSRAAPQSSPPAAALPTGSRWSQEPAYERHSGGYNDGPIRDRRGAPYGDDYRDGYRDDHPRRDERPSRSPPRRAPPYGYTQQWGAPPAERQEDRQPHYRDVRDYYDKGVPLLPAPLPSSPPLISPPAYAARDTDIKRPLEPHSASAPNSGAPATHEASSRSRWGSVGPVTHPLPSPPAAPAYAPAYAHAHAPGSTYPVASSDYPRVSAPYGLPSSSQITAPHTGTGTGMGSGAIAPYDRATGAAPSAPIDVMKLVAPAIARLPPARHGRGEEGRHGGGEEGRQAVGEKRRDHKDKAGERHKDGDGKRQRTSSGKERKEKEDDSSRKEVFLSKVKLAMKNELHRYYIPKLPAEERSSLMAQSFLKDSKEFKSVATKVFDKLVVKLQGQASKGYSRTVTGAAIKAYVAKYIQERARAKAEAAGASSVTAAASTTSAPHDAPDAEPADPDKEEGSSGSGEEGTAVESDTEAEQ